MPRGHAFRGLRVVIYPNDHRPPHVHVEGPGAWAVFNLNGPIGPVDILDSDGFRQAALNEIAAELNIMIARCCAEWSRIHGHF